MAHGIPCRRCGHQETAHDLKSTEDYEDVVDKILHGYEKTLNQCPGYTPEDPALAYRLDQRALDQELYKCGLFERPAD